MPAPKHLARKAFHATGILIVVLYRALEMPSKTAGWILAGATGLLLLLDLARARWPALIELFDRSLRAILDPKDAKGVNGSTLYFAGCAASLLLFPEAPACAGILALALGDSSAAIIGSSIRSPRWGRVSLAGSLACFLAATLMAWIFLPLPVALAGGAAAALLEAFSGSKLDNLTIPAGTALVLFLLSA